MERHHPPPPGVGVVVVIDSNSGRQAGRRRKRRFHRRRILKHNSRRVLIVRSVRAVVELLGVEWISDKKPVLEQVGSLVIAGVAAFAAWLAAHTASKRQHEQLASAEREQMRSLEHDRKLNNRDALRATTTAALGHCIDTQAEFEELSSQSAVLSFYREKINENDEKVAALDDDQPDTDEAKTLGSNLRAGLDELQSKWNSAVRDVQDKGRVVTYDNVRISVLVGTENAVTRAHSNFIDAFSRGRTALTAVAFSSSSETRQKFQTYADDRLAEALSEFRDSLLAEFDRPLWETIEPTGNSTRSRASLLQRITNRIDKRSSAGR